MTSTASDAPRLRRLAIEMLLLSAVAVGLPAFAWIRGDGRLSLGAAGVIAMDSYEAALGLIDPAEPMLIGPPFRWRLTSQGIVQDRRVEMSGDLGYVAYVGEDMEIAVAAYELALDVARREGYPATTIASLESAAEMVAAGDPSTEEMP